LEFLKKYRYREEDKKMKVIKQKRLNLIETRRISNNITEIRYEVDLKKTKKKTKEKNKPIAKILIDRNKSQIESNIVKGLFYNFYRGEISMLDFKPLQLSELAFRVLLYLDDCDGECPIDEVLEVCLGGEKTTRRQNYLIEKTNEPFKNSKYRIFIEKDNDNIKVISNFCNDK
jgi:hypothetical protein